MDLLDKTECTVTDKKGINDNPDDNVYKSKDKDNTARGLSVESVHLPRPLMPIMFRIVGGR